MIGLLLAPLVDRLSRRRLLIVSDLVARRGLLRAAVRRERRRDRRPRGVVGIATGFFRPAVYAGMPNLVDDEELPNANSLLQAVENLTWMIGPVLGGVLIAAQGPDLAYWLNAATFSISAVLARPDPGAPASGGHGREPRPLARHRRRDPVRARSRTLLAVLVVWNIVMLGNAAINVAEVVLAKVALDAGTSASACSSAAAGSA